MCRGFPNPEWKRGRKVRPETACQMLPTHAQYTLNCLLLCQAVVLRINIQYLVSGYKGPHFPLTTVFLLSLYLSSLFLRPGLMQFRLTLNLPALYLHAASISRVLGLQTCTSKPGLCSIGDQTQGLVHARQACYQLDYFFSLYFFHVIK